MNKIIQSKKFIRKDENSAKNHINFSHDCLENLLISIEKYKNVLSKPNVNSMLLNSANSAVMNSINYVVSEYGEESVKRHSRNIVKETGDNKKHEFYLNDLWSKIVKDFQEIIVSHPGLNHEFYISVLTMISQIHERQSLRINNSSILQDICLKLIENFDNIDSKIRSQYLRCVASFILGNLNIIPKELFANLSGAFFKESEKHLSKPTGGQDFESLECLKYCISGQTNLCYISNSQTSEDFLSKRFQICGRFLQIFISCLEQCPDFVDLSPTSRFRMQHQCLHGLNYVSQRPHGLSIDNIERLLGVLKMYCGFGWFTGSRNFETFGEQDESLILTGLSTDDFGFYGNNGNTSVTCKRPMKKWETKTRKLALELLLKILEKSWKKVSPKIWMEFMPFGVDSGRSFDLLKLFEYELDHQVRLLIIQAIEMCISDCREFLITAQYRSISGTFVSHSQSLAAGLIDMHKKLLSWVLAADCSLAIRLRLLRCIGVLIRTAPFHRLKSGLIRDIVCHLRQLFLESGREDSSIRISVLDCFSALVGLESTSAELQRLLIDPNGEIERDGCIDPTKIGGRPSWLVQLCVRLAHPALVDQLWTGALSPESWGTLLDPLVEKIVSEGCNQTDPDLRCKALGTVAAMLPHHCSLVRPSLDTLNRTLLACIDESFNGPDCVANAALRSDVLKVFSGFLGTMENKKVKRYLGIIQDCRQDLDHYYDKNESRFFWASSNSELVCSWWSSFLPAVVRCLKDGHDIVRRASAQCLCFMCEPVLEQLLDREAIRHHWSLLLAMFHDPSNAVGCQAIWSLGYWVALRPLNYDADFINALIEACSRLCNATLSDCSVGYLECANAAWTLSNAVEVLVAHKECLLSCCRSIGEPSQCTALVQQYFSDVDGIARLMQLFCDLCGIKKAGQVAASARIHENAIRGLGYLCRFINEDIIDHLSSRNLLLLASETFCKAVQLSDKAGRVKVKWNACLSVSHIYHNQSLLSNLEIFNLPKLNEALVTTVISDRYFKVRNNSLVSIIKLIDCGGRSCLGNQLFETFFGPLAEACLSVIHKTTIPFSEVHRHCLCLYLLHFTLLKLVSILSHPDLEALNNKSDLLSLLATVFSEQIPSIWKHLRNLNRAFNKQALLTETLMLKLSVSATHEEVDLLLSQIRLNLDVNWPSTESTKLTVKLLEQLYRSVLDARISDDDIISQDEKALSFCDSLSDDDGLMTKRPGMALMFNQIYD